MNMLPTCATLDNTARRSAFSAGSIPCEPHLAGPRPGEGAVGDAISSRLDVSSSVAGQAGSESGPNLSRHSRELCPAGVLAGTLGGAAELRPYLTATATVGHGSRKPRPVPGPRRPPSHAMERIQDWITVTVPRHSESNLYVKLPAFNRAGLVGTGLRLQPLIRRDSGSASAAAEHASLPVPVSLDDS